MNAGEWICRVDIVTKGPGVLLPDTTGLSVPIQAARVVVTSSGESRSHVVVWPASLPWELPADASIAKLFPTDVVSCVRADVAGDTTLSCAAADEPTMFAAASAAATLKRSWGWDESPSILVRFTAGASLVVDPVYDGSSWSVTRRAGV